MRSLYEQIHTVEDMSLLNGVAFEEFLAEVFRDFGYDVDTTPKSGDYGADLIMAKDGRKAVVQAKQYAGAAGFEAVKEAHFAKDFYKADEAWVVATHGFTPQAVSAAKSTGVRLISGAEIARMIEETTARRSQRGVGFGDQLELAFGQESDSSLFTIAGEHGEKLLQYHGHELNVIIPSDLGIRFIGSHAFSDPGEYVRWPEGFVDPVCDWARIRSVVVPEGVTIIGSATFRGCKSLRSVSLPSTLRYIGSSAFEGCVSLQEIELPQGIKSIGGHAFERCENLSTLVLPASETAVEIGWDAFRESGVRSLTIRGNYQLGMRCFERCFNLTNVSIESIQGEGEDASKIGVESLSESAFELCRMLKDVHLPDTLATIGDGAFAQCVSLETVKIPESVTEIGVKAFFECHRLSSIRIPPGVEVIKGETFTRCWMLSDVSLSEGLRSIEKEAFFVCSRMRRICLPTTVDEIASRAFASCDALTDVVMSPNVRTIRTRTFDRCAALTNVTLPEGIQTIEERAFWKCRWLRKVKLPASIEMVATRAFEGCEALQEVWATPGCSGTFHRSAFLGCPLMEKDNPIKDLPATVTIVNDARFPSMFEGPAHELHALKFDAHVYEGYSRYVRGFLIVDRGIEGLNSFSSNSADAEGASFWVKLNDGCGRGYYSVRGTLVASKPDTVFEGYLEPKEHEYSSSGSSQHGFGTLMGGFSVYLYNCHLMASPSIDGAWAARLEDSYRNAVRPLVSEYLRVEGDESGRGRKFESDKLATLDGLHAQIKAANEVFESEGKRVGLDYAYYIHKYWGFLGSGPTPSEKAARI